MIVRQLFPGGLWRRLRRENAFQRAERIGVITHSSLHGRQQILPPVVTLQRQHRLSLGTGVSLLGEQTFKEPRAGLAPGRELLAQPLGFDLLISWRSVRRVDTLLSRDMRGEQRMLGGHVEVLIVDL